MEEEIYERNTEIYKKEKSTANLKSDSKGRVIFKRGRSYHFVCKTCGAVKYIRPFDIERGRGCYCSRECYHANDNPRVWFFCPVCGTLFSLKYSSAMRSKTHYCTVECYNTAKSKLYVPVDLSPSPELAYILGVMVGDGCGNEYIKKQGEKEKKSYDIKFAVIDYAFAKSFASALRKIGLHPNIWKDKKTRNRDKNEQLLWHTEAYSKIFVRFYLELKNDIKKLEKFIRKCPEGKKEFLRGFYESEGHHGVYNYRRRYGIQHVKHLHMTTTNLALADLVITFLHDLGFHPYTSIQKRKHLGWKDKIMIHLPPKEHSKFLKAIAPVIKK